MSCDAWSRFNQRLRGGCVFFFCLVSETNLFYEK